MTLDQDIKRFKRAFWGRDSIIQVLEGETVHKLTSLKKKNANFLEGCTVKMYDLPVEFFEATEMGARGRKVACFEVEGYRPGCYYRSPPDKVFALEALYHAFTIAYCYH